MSDSKGPARVLVTGEMRSGTTFTANFLNSQKNCIVYADFLRNLFVEARQLGIADINDSLSQRERNVLLSNLVAEGFSLGFSGFQEISASDFSTWYQLYKLGLGTIDRGGLDVLGSKVTRAYGLLPQLMEQGVKIVFCIRDPRDVLLSRKNRFSEYHLFTAVAEWKASYDLSRELDGHPNFHLLRFESLIDKTSRADELAGISKFLGVPLEEGVESLSIRNGVKFVANSSFKGVSKPFDQSAIYRWRKYLDSDEVVFVTRCLEKELDAMGYERAEISDKAFRKLRREFFSYRLKRGLEKPLLRLYRTVFR